MIPMERIASSSSINIFIVSSGFKATLILNKKRRLLKAVFLQHIGLLQATSGSKTFPLATRPYVSPPFSSINIQLYSRMVRRFCET